MKRLLLGEIIKVFNSINWAVLAPERTKVGALRDMRRLS